MIQKFQLRRGTAAAWTAANPILSSGEQGLETDTRKIKIGDGSTAWNALGYDSPTAESVLALLPDADLEVSTLTLKNESAGLKQKMFFWGTDGNQIMRVVSSSFEVDADVVDYLTAVETAKGSYVSGVQFVAIHAFVAAEKAAGRWSLHKRIYLPIWANANANLVDLVTATSATWGNVGSVTQGSGFIQNASNGYLNVGASFSGLGVTSTYPTILALVYGGNNNSELIMGGYTTGGMEKGLVSGGSGTVINAKGDTTVSITGQTGIFLSSRDAGLHYGKRRTSAGGTLTTFTAADSGSSSYPTGNVFISAGNYDGAPSFNYTGKIGLAGISAQLTQAQADSYLTNLKTLWETCTGLTLP